METEVRPLVPWRAPKNVALQHNALAEARYRLSVRAQKLLIRLLDELDQRGDNFCDIKLFLKELFEFVVGRSVGDRQTLPRFERPFRIRDPSGKGRLRSGLQVNFPLQSFVPASQASAVLPRYSANFTSLSP